MIDYGGGIWSKKEIVAEEKVIDKKYRSRYPPIASKRQVYMAKLLEERGYRPITWDLREGQMPRGKKILSGAES